MLDSKRVLIVDDDHDIRRGAHFRLKAAGYDTLQARNGREGVDSAEGTLPDVIVMDVRMPDMSGVEAMEQLQSHPDTREIPVIIVSASPSEESAALERGARYFLRKPYSSRALVAAVNAAADDSSSNLRSSLATTRTSLLHRTTRTDQQNATTRETLLSNRQPASRVSTPARATRLTIET